MVKMDIGAGGAVFYGLTLNELVAVATFLYLSMQIGLRVAKYWRLPHFWRRAR